MKSEGFLSLHRRLWRFKNFIKRLLN